MRTEIPDQQECAQRNFLVKHLQVQRAVSGVDLPFCLLNALRELDSSCRVESKRHHSLAVLGHFFENEFYELGQSFGVSPIDLPAPIDNRGEPIAYSLIVLVYFALPYVVHDELLPSV